MVCQPAAVPQSLRRGSGSTQPDILSNRVLEKEGNWKASKPVRAGNESNFGDSLPPQNASLLWIEDRGSIQIVDFRTNPDQQRRCFPSLISKLAPFKLSESASSEDHVSQADVAWHFVRELSSSSQPR